MPPVSMGFIMCGAECLCMWSDTWTAHPHHLKYLHPYNVGKPAGAERCGADAGSINLSDSEAERSAQQLLSAFPGLPESKGQTIHLAGGVFTPNVAAQLPVPLAINC